MRYQGLITENQASKLVAYVRRISHGGRVHFDLLLTTSAEEVEKLVTEAQEDE